MDRLSSEASELLRRYRAERPGVGRARENYRAVTARLEADATEVPPQADGWQRQLGWGFAAAAAAALLLVVVDAVLPEAKNAAADVPASAPSEAVDRAREVEHSGAAVQSAPVPRAPRPLAEPAPTVDVDPRPGSKPQAVQEATPATAVGPEALAEEARLLRRAREALRRGDLTAARSAIDEHARRFPKGALAEDRVAYDVVLRCRVGDPLAGSRLGAFKLTYPRSPHAPRVAEACRDRANDWVSETTD